MTKLKPKLIIAGSNKKKSGFGYLLTLILVFALGVYVGMKVDDTEFSRDQIIGNSPDHSQTTQNVANQGSEDVKEAATIRERGSTEIPDITSNPGTITKSDIADPSAADSNSTQSQLEENENSIDGQQLQDIPVSESSETEVANINESSPMDGAGSETSGLLGPDTYRLQVAAFENLDDANQAVSRLQDKGYDAYVLTTTNSRGEMWNLIKVGKFETAQEAWNSSTLYQSKEGGDVIVESSQRGRVYKESLEQDNAEE